MHGILRSPVFDGFRIDTVCPPPPPSLHILPKREETCNHTHFLQTTHLFPFVTIGVSHELIQKFPVFFYNNDTTIDTPPQRRRKRNEHRHPVRRYSPCTRVHHHYRYLSYAYRISGPIASSKPCTWAELRDLRASPVPFTCGDPWSIVISEKEFR